MCVEERSVTSHEILSAPEATLSGKYCRIALSYNINDVLFP